MPETVENYWGTNTFTTSKSPVLTLIEQQAEILSAITEGRVKGVVKESTESGRIYVSLYVGVPALGDYQYKLFTVAYSLTADPAAPFPIVLSDSLGSSGGEIQGMEKFEIFLREYLSSPTVHRAIGTLMKFGDDRSAS